MLGLRFADRREAIGGSGTLRRSPPDWLVVVWLAWAASAGAQEGPAPPEPLEQGLRPLEAVQVLEAPGIDVAALLDEDRNGESRDTPLRFASPFVLSATPADHGSWEDSIDGRNSVWRLRVASAGAVSLSLGFERYLMPPGGRMLVYTPDYAEIAGPFTDADNESHGELWTPVLPGGELVIEVSVPAGLVDELRIRLGSVNRGYRDFSDLEKQLGCNVGIACSEGDGYRDVARSVGRMVIGGSSLCTGALLNNTSGDGKPYLLTAAHCDVDDSNAASVVVYWNYEGRVCGALSGGRLQQSQTGAYFRAGHDATDFTLIELDDLPDPAHDVYWSGWDRTPSDPSRVAGIHHPRGKEKAISLRFRPTATTAAFDMRERGGGTHIMVRGWDEGTTEPGSSGSPLFDQNRRIVGQLHGGNGQCGDEVTDWYGRLSMSWTGGGTARTGLGDWLDPRGTGATVLNGRDRSGASEPADAGSVVVDLGVDVPDTQWVALGLGTVAVSALLLVLAARRPSVAVGARELASGSAQGPGKKLRRDEWGRITGEGVASGRPTDSAPGGPSAPRSERQCYTVGRDRECDVFLDDDSVSRRHAEVERLSGGRLHVTDCQSTNGTFILVDDAWEPVRQRMVTASDRVRFGTYVLTGDELDARCAHARAGDRPAGETPPTPPVGDPASRRFRRNPETGEIESGDR